MYTEHCEQCPLKGKSEINVGKGPSDARFLVVVDSPSAKPETYNRLMPQSSTKMFSKHAMAEQFQPSDFYFYPQVRCPYDPDQYSTKEKSLIQKCRQGAKAETERNHSAGQRSGQAGRGPGSQDHTRSWSCEEVGRVPPYGHSPHAQPPAGGHVPATRTGVLCRLGYAGAACG